MTIYLVHNLLSKDDKGFNSTQNPWYPHSFLQKCLVQAAHLHVSLWKSPENNWFKAPQGHTSQGKSGKISCFILSSLPL